MSENNENQNEVAVNEKPTVKRTVVRDEEFKHKLLNRLHRVEGQIRGIEHMVEKGAYCTDILIQSSAASAALNAFDKEIITEHMETVVTQKIKEGDEEIIKELALTLQRLMK